MADCFRGHLGVEGGKKEKQGKSLNGDGTNCTAVLRASNHATRKALDEGALLQKHGKWLQEHNEMEERRNTDGEAIGHLQPEKMFAMAAAAGSKNTLQKPPKKIEEKKINEKKQKKTKQKQTEKEKKRKEGGAGKEDKKTSKKKMPYAMQSRLQPSSKEDRSNPKEDLASSSSSSSSRACSKEGCNSKPKALGLCVKHGAFGICATSGCSTFSLKRGRCIKHFADKSCSTVGSKSAAAVKGLSRKHRRLNTNGSVSGGNRGMVRSTDRSSTHTQKSVQMRTAKGEEKRAAKEDETDEQEKAKEKEEKEKGKAKGKGEGGDETPAPKRTRLRELLKLNHDEYEPTADELRKDAALVASGKQAAEGKIAAELAVKQNAAADKAARRAARLATENTLTALDMDIMGWRDAFGDADECTSFCIYQELRGLRTDLLLTIFASQPANLFRQHTCALLLPLGYCGCLATDSC